MNETIAIIMLFLENNVISVAEMAETGAATLAEGIRDITNQDEGADELAEEIHSIAVNLHERDGTFPTTYNELTDEVGVPEDVAWLLMRQVFGSTQMSVSLYTRKIVCAIDFFDWEACDAVRKCDIKMKNVSASHVRRSLRTWLPIGIGSEFEAAMESLGDVIGGNPIGFWGQLKSLVNRHFPPADKHEVMAMAEQIRCFFKETKSGGRKKHDL